MIIYNFFSNVYQHIKYSRILNKVYKEENLLNNLTQLFQHNFKKDWIGRIYTVINPYIVNGKYDEHAVVFEKTDNGLNNNAYIEQYIMEKLLVADKFIYNNNLFDLLTYNIKKLDDNGNFLFIMKPITLDDFLNSLKKFIILLGILTVIGILVLIYINNFLS